MINKGHLLLKLRCDNININIEELDEIIDIYNHLIDFVYFDIKITEDKKFSFIESNAKLHPMTEENIIDCYYNIFVGIIKLMKYDYLELLDYLLIYCELGGVWKSQDKIYRVSKYMDYLFGNYEYHKDDIFYCFIDDYYYNVYVRLCEKQHFIYLNTIPDSYRKIMKMYNEIYHNYFLDFERYDEFGEIEYSYFICMTYFYFVKNNLFINDPEGVYNFLSELNANIEDRVDKINLVGLKDEKNHEDYKQILEYIDSLYKNQKAKVKIIK